MRVRFWGVRGSVPWATAGSIGHGCNTPCVEVRSHDSREVLVLDAGSGIVGLGESLGSDPHAVPILLTHYHWDHLQGLPFFAPLYHINWGWGLTLWAPALPGAEPAWVDAVFQPPFFPVPFDRLPARPAVRLVQPGQLSIRGFEISALPLNHPGGAFAYRIRGTRGDLVYATDHEFGDSAYDRALAAFAAGAAAIILDAHYTPEEASAHRGWGHSDWRQCAEFARHTAVSRLWLFHHKPGRTDLELIELEARAREIFRDTEAAGEGDAFEV
jgi:phosphoribosyl 1,2-cyclic phosphodiesterase